MFDNDDHGPPDSDYGDSEADHVWADLARSEAEPDQITDGMLRWEPGELPTHTIERILMDALADLWRDCYRRDNTRARERMFREKVAHLISAATNGQISMSERR